jgi:dihydrolipoamide dehydrogenase
MIGARCADLIAEAVVAMEFKASAEDISRMSHAHPTFTEAIKEAALAATDNRALRVIHFILILIEKGCPKVIWTAFFI